MASPSPLDAIIKPKTTVDTLSNIEALSPLIGDRGCPLNSPYNLTCRVAGTWEYRFPGELGVLSPPNGAPADIWVNQASSQIVNIGKMSRFIFDPTGGMQTLRACVVNTGATFDVRVKLRRRADPAEYHYSGIMLRESATDKCAGFTNQVPGVTYWANSTTYSGSEVLADTSFLYDGWMRVVLDAANITYYGSLDGGLNWTQVFQQAKNVRFTAQPNQVGIVGQCRRAVVPVGLRLICCLGL